jgi:Xaa-Pro aminopeptidase
MFPYMHTDDANTLIGSVSTDTYLDTNDVNTNYEYYNTKNIYYHVGYWNEEIYRIGIVYIMDDGSLSPVFNLRGINGLPRFEELNTTYTQLKEESTQLYSEGKRVYLEVDEQNYTIKNNNNNLQNAKGVIRFND